MPIEIRHSQTDDELMRHVRTAGYVFGDDDDETDQRRLRLLKPEYTMDAYVDGVQATTMTMLPLTVNIEGARIPVAGVAGVGTWPQYRRRGLLRQVMSAGFANMREKGQPLAALWASWGAIYQRFGFGWGSTHAEYQFDPRYAGLRDTTPPPGQVHAGLYGEFKDEIRGLHDRWAQGRTMALDRTGLFWEIIDYRMGMQKRPWVAVYRDQKGKPQGYIAYTIKHPAAERPPDEPPQDMNIEGFVTNTIDAWRALWMYVCGHDLVKKVYWYRVPEDDPALLLTLEPRALNRKTDDGLWLRIVDAPQALKARPYAATGSVVLGIEGDDCAPWNNGSLLLETDGTEVEVVRVRRKADLLMAPESLASLYSGHSSATTLARAGLVQAKNAAALATADALFATDRPPYCPDGF